MKLLHLDDCPREDVSRVYRESVVPPTLFFLAMLTIFAVASVVQVTFNGLGHAQRPAYWMMLGATACWAVLLVPPSPSVRTKWTVRGVVSGASDVLL